MTRLLEQPLPLAFDQLLWTFVRRLDNPKTETRRLRKGSTCRWGEPGQLLYGQEAMEQDAEGMVVYASDKARVLWEGKPVRWPWRMQRLAAMYAPAWTAREFFLNVGVREELLTEIDEEGAIAEGMERHPEKTWQWRGFDGGTFDTARGAFSSLWDLLAKKPGAFYLNPPVWVITLWRFPIYEAEQIRNSLQAEGEAP